MSENLEELLDVDEENEGDYDLGDDEEDALLDDNFEISGKEKSSVTFKKRGAEQDHEPEPDFVLDLDDGTELNDEDDAEISLNTSLNIDEEQERNRKTDKFTNERIVLNTDMTQHLKKSGQNDGKYCTDKQNQRGLQFRGKGRGGGRGNYQNEQNRNAQYHQKKKVLINPHFKGNVQIRNNVSLAWDSSHLNNQNSQQKKPYMYIHPWVQNQQPVLNNYVPPTEPVSVINSYGNSSYQSLPQMNPKPPVHQRLGINPSLCNTIVDNQQYVHFPPQQSFPQIPQVPNQMYEQIPPHFNNFTNVPPQFNNQQMFQQKLPLYNQPPVYNNQQSAYPNHPMQGGNYNSVSCNTFQSSVPQHSNPVFIQPPCNEYNVYSQPIPVQNVNARIVTPSLHYQKAEFISQKQYQQQRKFIQGSPGKRKFDNVKGDLKKKKRSLPSNLHEVQTIDITPVNEEAQPVIVEEEDEEMKAYRLKIEQQKLIREKILLQKEERRKQAAKKLQAEEEYKTVVSPNELIKNIEIPVITNVVKMEPEVLLRKSSRVNQNIVAIKTVSVSELSGGIVTSSSDVADAGPAEPLSKDHLNSFLSNRKIFAKDQSLADTPVVVVNNLATGTSVAKLRKLCQGVGDIQVRIVNGNRFIT